MPPARNTRVLIVDDQPNIHEDFREILKPGFGKSTDGLTAAFLPAAKGSSLPEFDLLHAATGHEACEIILAQKQRNRPVAVAFIDIRMPPGIDGVETVRRIRKEDRTIEIVLMTAYTDRPLSELVHDMELLDKLLYIRKPFVHEEVQQISVALTEKWNLECDLREERRLLVASQQRLAAVLDSIGEAIAMYDPKGHLIFANRCYAALLDVAEDELKSMQPDAVKALCRQRLRAPVLPSAAARSVTAGGGGVVERVGPDPAEENRLFYRLRKRVCTAEGGAIGEMYVYRDMSAEIEAKRMKAEVEDLRTALGTSGAPGGMVGSCASMQRLFALLRRAAKGSASVLVQGESGTGKELVAKFLHVNGARRKGPFLAVNCAAVPETLMESELFGHERGAFTGATGRRIGCFERAQGGTILLDEIGDMPLALQAKLLRVLQEREIQRVGGAATIPIDVHVVAATNKDLEAMMRAGEFREDLFYRIAVVPIVVPPLRARRDDIPALASHFLKQSAERNAKVIGGISPEALWLLLRHEWPGNVRELQNVMEHAVLMETTNVVQAGSLPGRLAPASPAAAVLPLREAEWEAEREAIARAVKASANNVMQAAYALGINRTTLYRKLKKYGLSADS